MLISKISRAIFKVSPWYDSIDAYRRRRYAADICAYWTAEEDRIGPLKEVMQRTGLLRRWIKQLAVASVLGVGCGYGAVLKALMEDEGVFEIFRKHRRREKWRTS